MGKFADKALLKSEYKDVLKTAKQLTFRNHFAKSLARKAKQDAKKAR